MPTVEKLAILS